MAQRKPGAPSSFHFCIRNRSPSRFLLCPTVHASFIRSFAKEETVPRGFATLAEREVPRSRPTGEEFEELRDYDNGVTDFRPHLHQGWRTSEHSKARCLANFLDELFLPNFLSPSENSNYVRDIESVLFATILFYNLTNDWYDGNYYWYCCISADDNFRILHFNLYPVFYLGKKLMNFIVSDIWDTNYISFNYKLT